MFSYHIIPQPANLHQPNDSCRTRGHKHEPSHMSPSRSILFRHDRRSSRGACSGTASRTAAIAAGTASSSDTRRTRHPATSTVAYRGLHQHRDAVRSQLRNSRSRRATGRRTVAADLAAAGSGEVGAAGVELAGAGPGNVHLRGGGRCRVRSTADGCGWRCS
jgi:hypothetical protein